MESPGRRDLVRWLYDNSRQEGGCIVIYIKPGVHLRLTPWVVHKILGLPIDGEMPPTYTMKQRNDEFNKLRVILGLLPWEDDQAINNEEDDVEDGDQVDDNEGDNTKDSEDGEEGGGGKNKKAIQAKKDVSMKLILEKLSKKRVLSEKESELKLKLFFMVVLDSYLLPCSSSTLNEKAVMHTRIMDLISKFNWSRVVYEDLRNSVEKWHADKDKPLKSRTIHGCCMVPLV